MIENAKKILNKGFPALTHRNFRYFWTGQCVSLIGTWVQRTAQQWLVYSMTKSPFLLGILGVFQFAPTLIFSLFAGVFVDRFPKKKILLTTQTIMMTQAFLLAFLVWTGLVRYWHILLLAALLGMVDTFDIPTRQSFFIELVGKEDLMGAIALNSASVNGARIIGPALSGLLMAYLGTAFCFFLNGLSFIAVLCGLTAVKTYSAHIRERGGSVLSETWAGLKHIAGSRTLSGAILTMLAVGTFAMNTNVLIPVYAKQILHRQAAGYSFLLSAMGFGSFIGALFVSARAKRGPKKKILFGSALSICLILLLLGLVRQYYLAIIILAVFGFSSLMFMTTTNSTIQLNADDQYRGRVMSVYNLAFLGTTPIGNLYAGFVSEKLGVNFGFFACGIAALLLVAGIILVMRKKAAGHISSP